MMAVRIERPVSAPAAPAAAPAPAEIPVEAAASFAQVLERAGIRLSNHARERAAGAGAAPEHAARLVEGIERAGEAKLVQPAVIVGNLNFIVDMRERIVRTVASDERLQRGTLDRIDGLVKA